MKKKLLRLAAASVLGLSLTTGVAAANSGSIDTTGPDSDNEIRVRHNRDVRVDNNNDIDVDNDVDQDARTGDADVRRNTRGGDAESGTAVNDTLLRARFNVNNSSSTNGLGGDNGNSSFRANIENTGPDSDNFVEYDNDVDIDIDNDNDISIDNRVDQNARSGDARVERNTSGGDARSGDASNINTTEVEVDVRN